MAGENMVVLAERGVETGTTWSGSMEGQGDPFVCHVKSIVSIKEIIELSQTGR